MRRTLPFVASLLLCSPLHALTEQHLRINIDGRPASLLLTPRDAAENAAFANGEHYRGQVEGDAASWVRLSHIDGRWQGLIHTQSGIHVLDSKEGTAKEARALSGLDVPMQCGAEADAPRHRHDVGSSLRESLGNYDSLCADAIDGVCAGVEVEMVFDQAFVAAFPKNYAAQAASLLNMVEGYYLDGFGIRLNNLGMTFLDSAVFPAESSSTDYLNDIREQKASGQLDFVTNANAILHVVRGKPFSDLTTAGIAWVGGLCNTNGYSSGSSVLYSQTVDGSPSLPLTALVTTHEIGHNLGARHDTAPEVSCPSGYIMDAMVNPYANEFSSCSKTAIKDFLGDISGWQACTNYPVKVNFNADITNALALASPQTIVHQFSVNYLKGYSTPSNANITIDMEGARSLGATLNGASCEISANQQRVTCPLSSAGTLAITLEPVWTRATLSLTPSFGSERNVFNVAADDGRYEYQFTTRGPASPDNLSADIDGNQVNLRWQDNTTNETGFEVQRRASGGEWTAVATTLPDTARYIDTLPGNGTFEYRVLTLREDINSAPSNVVSVYATPITRSKDSGGGGGSLGFGSMLLIAASLLRRGLRG